MRLRLQPVKSSAAEAKTVAQKARIQVPFGGKMVSLLSKKKKKKKVLLLTQTMSVRANSGNGGMGSNTSFICTE